MNYIILQISPPSSCFLHVTSTFSIHTQFRTPFLHKLRVSNPRSSMLCFAARCHVCKMYIYTIKIMQEFRRLGVPLFEKKRKEKKKKRDPCLSTYFSSPNTKKATDLTEGPIPVYSKSIVKLNTSVCLSSCTLHVKYERQTSN